jgi:hypothetical protein
VGGLSCGGSAVSFLGVVAVSHSKDLISINPFLPGFQDGCKVTAGENGLEQRTQMQNGNRDA